MNGCSILQTQNDPRWGSVRLGWGESSIAAYGCLLTCYAMLYSYALGRLVTPDEVNEWFKAGKKFNYNLLYIPNASLGIQGDIVKVVGRSAEIDKKNPVDMPASEMDKLKTFLLASDDNFAIGKVDFNRRINGCQSHFILLWGVDSKRNILANDPAYGTCRLISDAGQWKYYGATRPAFNYGVNDADALWRIDYLQTVRG